MDGTTADQTGVLAVIGIFVGLAAVFVLAFRWLSIEIRRAPRWIVTAAVPDGGPSRIVARTRDAHAAARAAGELADELERGGADTSAPPP